MRLYESAEMYLETIYRLSQESGYVRSIDVARAMGYSKPSVSRAVNQLKQGGYLEMDENGRLILTDAGIAVARKVYERHTVLSGLLMDFGVDGETAAQDACKIEHVISDRSFAAIKRYLDQKQST